MKEIQELDSKDLAQITGGAIKVEANPNYNGGSGGGGKSGGGTSGGGGKSKGR